MSVIWALYCDEADIHTLLAADSHVQMVTELVQRGFTRLVKGDVLMQGEPLVMKDSHGRTWDCMPDAMAAAHVTRLPDAAGVMARLDSAGNGNGGIEEAAK